jgi:hypothetical protein
MNREVCGICWCPYDDNGACGCQTLDAAMQQPRAMAQAYENGYKAGAAAEREACAKLAEATICDTHLPTGVRIYGTRVADAIRARGSA